jgi:hypothetical protein
MSCRSSGLEMAFFMVRFSFAMQHWKWDEKMPLLTSGTAAFARRFCSGDSHSRASAEKSVLNQATVVLLPGWQTAAFTAAIPKCSR